MPLGLAAVLLLSACATGTPPVQRQSSLQPDSIPEDAVFAFRVNRDDAVKFRGAIDQSGSGSDTGWAMLYPAPDVVTLFAAIGAHAALASQHQAGLLAQQQNAANAILGPYRPTLDTIKHRELLLVATTRKSFRHATRIIETESVDTASWIVETAPVFAMTQDESAVILDTAIQVFSPADRKKPVYQNIVRVVSAPRDGSDPETGWMEDEGAALKSTLESQFLRSLDLAILDVTTNPVAVDAHKTVRYRLGTSERIERGQVVRDECNEIILRTLRGWVMSIPKTGSQSTCPG